MTTKPETANTPGNSESLAGSVILASALSPVFALLFVALRFYTARRILRAIHVDDWLIVVALILSIGYSVSLIILAQHGLGYHREYLRAIGMRSLRPFMIIAVIPVSITGNLAPLFVKVSILRFYLRFSTSRRFNMVVYVLMFMVITANMLGAFAFVFTCQPIWYMWDYIALKGKGSCIAMDPWYGWLVIFNCVTDGVLLVLPAWILSPLRVSVSQKAALAAILGTGGFILGVSIFRCIFVASGWGDKDLTYKFATNYIWSIVEINVGIVCASAPCLRGLVGRYVPSLVQLGRRDDTVDLYTIPESQVARRLPRTPTDAGDKDPRHTAWIAASGRGKVFGPESSSSRGRGHNH